jgi:hypothetical protein
MAESRLVIVRHYEPLEPEERAEMLGAVYDRLFDAATLERLTKPQRKSTIFPASNGKGAGNESRNLLQGKQSTERR